MFQNYDGKKVFFVILHKVCTNEVLKSQRWMLTLEPQTRLQSDNKARLSLSELC